jgi:putative PIN family toxin of toxin-antitoxin system
MRIVIDTNIWVSGLLWKGEAWRLLRLAEGGLLEVCIAYPMLLELEEVLSYPRFAPRLLTLQQTPAQLAGFALSISVAVDVARTWPPIITADPDDDLFVLCALAAGADCVVTADHHLLSLGAYRGIPIITIGEFFTRIALG